ncbi:hypothetical protein E2C01_076294 [Portunus trituberculatus]|uniref:Uncharacterized protein n=1 Tax=Portunus trituberculatus TaxID=210409 RepID=A0A5B7II68_PORTR|nr:hypothetical protein [Portunus trituberculatus]
MYAPLSSTPQDKTRHDTSRPKTDPSRPQQTLTSVRAFKFGLPSQSCRGRGDGGGGGGGGPYHLGPGNSFG